MIKGTTKSGFDFVIADDVINDWAFIECMDEMADNPAKIVKFVKLALGEEQYKALKEHNTIKGKVSAERMNADITEILETEETKNS